MNDRFEFVHSYDGRSFIFIRNDIKSIHSYSMTCGFRSRWTAGARIAPRLRPRLRTLGEESVHRVPSTPLLRAQFAHGTALMPGVRPALSHLISLTVQREKTSTWPCRCNIHSFAWPGSRGTKRTWGRVWVVRWWSCSLSGESIEMGA